MFLAAIIGLFFEDVGDASVLMAYRLMVGNLRASFNSLKPFLAQFYCMLYAT